MKKPKKVWKTEKSAFAVDECEKSEYGSE